MPVWSSGSGVGGEKSSCTFPLDEALSKQKVMTCEVVLTDAAARLPDRAARRLSRGPFPAGVVITAMAERHLINMSIFLFLCNPPSQASVEGGGTVDCSAVVLFFLLYSKKSELGR